MRASTLVAQRASALRAAGNHAGAAAFELRYLNICPNCGGIVVWSREDVRTGTRHIRCGRCLWAATVSEAAYRGRPDIGLRDVCLAALTAKASRTARAAAPRPPRRPAPPQEAQDRRSTRDQASDTPRPREES